VAEFSGTVVWFNNNKGYGFLKDRNDREVFCHYSAILSEGYKHLSEGDEVEYDVVTGRQGPQAANVKRLKKD
jgi:cold shock protein